MQSTDVDWYRSAKYIEGLENRLGRMESLLRLSGTLPARKKPLIRRRCRWLTCLRSTTGLLGEDDGATDLGTLERRLAEKTRSRQASMVASNPTSPSHTASGPEGNASTPQSSLTSPEPPKDEKRNSLTPENEGEKEEEVAALSEMMCSLVTNNSGETRYLGKQIDRSMRCELLPRACRTDWYRSRLLLGLLHLLP